MIPPTSSCVHFDLDSAWPPDALPGGACVDVRAWGPRLRYTADTRAIEAFYEEVRPQTAAFTLFGSGDFHHLSALWLRRVEEPFTLVSFDNHPDWDIRPPRWGCGTWMNRALAQPALQNVAIWGCGNFELNWPGYLYVDRAALRTKRLSVWPWTERLKPSGRRRWVGMTRGDWHAQFAKFARGSAGRNFYVTVDLDCLSESEAVTNWEQGLFAARDVAWALGQLAASGKIVGGDVCGAYSAQHYARFWQRFAARIDHPKKLMNASTAAAQNRVALATIWSALTQSDDRYAGTDQQHSEPESR